MVDTAAMQHTVRHCPPSILSRYLALADAGADPARGLDTAAMLHAAPLPGSFSRFYGDSASGGVPITLPRGRPPPAGVDEDAEGGDGGTGALQLCVGDMATVALQVGQCVPV